MTTRTSARSRVAEDDISLALNPPRFVKHRRRLIRLARSPSRVWPLAAINGRSPVVLELAHPGQRGVELAYPRMTPGDAISSCPIGSPNGTATHILPAMTAALAIDDGEILFAGRLGHGFGMIIDHGNGWASHTRTCKRSPRFGPTCIGGATSTYARVM